MQYDSSINKQTMAYNYWRLPLEPYVTNAIDYYRIDPTFEPLKFYTMLRDEYGAYVESGSSFAYEKPYFFFNKEEDLTAFILRFS